MLFKVPPPRTFFPTRSASAAVALLSKMFMLIIPVLEMIVKTVGSVVRSPADWTDVFLQKLFFHSFILDFQGFVLLL